MRPNSYLIKATVSGALGGLLFGFDTAVIAGAIDALSRLYHLTGWTQGKGTQSDYTLVAELTEALKIASICGLGQFAHMPITSVLQYFPDEVKAHVFEKRCPEGVCPMREV